MASWTSTFTSGGAQLIVNVTESNVSVANNTSLINWSIQIKKLGSYNSYNNGGATIYLKTNGVTRYSSSSFTIKGMSVNTTKTLGSGSYTVTHNAQGAFSFPVRAQFTSGTSLGSASINQTFTCTTIPRVSTITKSKSEVTANGTDTITITSHKKSTSFTDTISIKIGSTTVISSAPNGTPLTIPLSWNNYITTAKSATATATVTTKSGSTTIGTASTTFTVKVPDSVVPTVSATLADANGYGDDVKPYLVGLSKYQVTVTSAGAYGSTIKSISIGGNGTTKTVENPSSTEVVSATSVLQDATYDSIICTVVDSRGTRASYTISDIYTHEYKLPTIDQTDHPPTAVRCDQGGGDDPNGDYIKNSIVFSCYDIRDKNDNPINTVTGTVSWKKRSDISYSQSDSISSGVDKIIYTEASGHSHTWDVLYAVTDTIGGTATAEIQLNTKDAVFSAKLGFQVSVGSSAENGEATLPTFESKWYTMLPSLDIGASDIPRDSNNDPEPLDDGTIRIFVDTSAGSGTTDGDLYQALVDLGWTSVIES